MAGWVIDRPEPAQEPLLLCRSPRRRIRGWEAVDQFRFTRVFGGDIMTRHQRFFAGMFLGVGLLLPGCGGGGPKVIVTGVVTLDGKPLEGAMVSFVPDDDKLPTGGATTDKDG